MRKQKGIVEMKRIQQLVVGVARHRFQVVVAVPSSGPHDDHVVRVDLADRVDDLLLYRIPSGVGYSMRLVENFVIQTLGASLIARSQLTPHRNQNLANLWIGVGVYIKGVVVQNEMEA